MLDPFFAALRERRPDIDIIVLPPEPLQAPRELAGTDMLAHSAQILDATVAALASRLPGAVIVGPDWVDLGDEGVRRVARIDVDTRGGATVLAQLEQEFKLAGWQSTLAVGAYHRWTASQRDVQIVATWSERHNGLTATVRGRALTPASGAFEVVE